MKIKPIYFKIFIILLCFISFGGIKGKNAIAETNPIIDQVQNQEDVLPDKKWTIKFNCPIDWRSAERNISVVDSSGKVVKTYALPCKGDEFFLLGAPEEGYKPGETYYLNISKGIRSRDGKGVLKESRQVKFKVSDLKFPEDIDKKELNKESSIVKANHSFTVNLMQKLIEKKEKENIVFSPLSLSVVLAMTQNGTKEDTQKEILSTLGLDNIDSKEINDEYYNLLYYYRYLPNGGVRTADSIWIQQGAQIKKDFIDLGKKYYNSKISTLDFKDPNAVNVINDWVAQNTEKLIPSILEQIPQNTQMILADTLYFNGKWSDEFLPQQTEKEEFTLSNNEKIKVDMMKDQRYVGYVKGEDFQAIRLHYLNDMSMLVFLPEKEKNVNEFVKNLSKDGLEHWMDSFQDEEIKLGVPKFKVENEENLVEPLQKLGIISAFDQTKANLQGIDKDLCIGQIKQKCYVEVDEQGTRAAAVTVELMTGAAPPAKNPPEVYINRPFCFAIVDNKTRTILFMGKIENPNK